MLTHITLNTGHTAVTPRSDVDQLVIDRLLPVLDNEGGAVPGMPGWYIDTMTPQDRERTPRPGAAFFQIADRPNLSSRPAVMGFVAWHEAQAEDAWRMAGTTYGAQLPTLVTLQFGLPMPAKAPPLPWMVVWLTPHALSVPPGIMTAFGDLERCIAWAMIER